jgi:hypothetical protein
MAEHISSPRFRFVPPVRRQSVDGNGDHICNLPDVTGGFKTVQIPKPKNHEATSQLNFTNIPLSLSAREAESVGSKKAAFYRVDLCTAQQEHLSRSKIDRATRIINHQRSQLTKLAWRCHHLESHITKHGTRSEFEKELKSLDGTFKPKEFGHLFEIESRFYEETSHLTNSDSTHTGQNKKLRKAHQEIQKLKNRVDILTSSLRRLAPHPDELLTRWHSGPEQVARRSSNEGSKSKSLTARQSNITTQGSRTEESRMSGLSLRRLSDLISLLNDKSDLDGFSERLVQEVATILNATEAAFLLIDHVHGNLYAHVVNNKDIPYKRRIPVGKGIIGSCVLSNSPVNLITCKVRKTLFCS